MTSSIALLVLLAAVLTCYFIYIRSGDTRYDKDGIGKIVRLFQFITIHTKPATRVVRTEYVEILKRYINTFNNNTEEIIGTSAEIKEEVYRRMTGSTDYFYFDQISSRLVRIANGEISLFGTIPVVYYIIRSGVYQHNELIMKISLSATLCTLLCLPQKRNNLKENALEYKLIRCSERNPFVGVNACPMLNQWKNIVLPHIVNLDPTPPRLRGDIIKYC